MSDFDVRDKYDSLEQPWWANDFLILVFTMINIGIIIVDLELELFENNFSLWWKLAALDLILVGFFFADLIEDYNRCNDKSWWWKTHGWEFIGIPPMFLAGLPFLSGVISLKFLRLIRAFAGILRLIGATQRANVVPVGKQVQHLFMIVFSLIVSGAFFVYIFEENYYQLYCMGINPPGDCARVIRDFPSALWWALVTTTTVGYGDLSPVTGPGKLVAASLMLVGIGLVGSLAATFSQLFYSNNQIVFDPNAQNTDTNPLILLERLASLHDGKAISDDDFETAMSLIRARMIAELRMLRIENDSLTTLPIPLQVSAKMVFIDKMKKIDSEIQAISEMFEEE